MRRNTVIAVAPTLVLCAVVTWQFVGAMSRSVHLSFAYEQTEIFAEMANKACEALQHSPPDVRTAVGFLEYAHNYYPSGSKQTSGSRLDIIVERSRLLAELRVIQMLKQSTGKDFGTDADIWISEFSEATFARRRAAAKPK